MSILQPGRVHAVMKDGVDLSTVIETVKGYGHPVARLHQDNGAPHIIEIFGISHERRFAEALLKRHIDYFSAAYQPTRAQAGVFLDDS